MDRARIVIRLCARRWRVGSRDPVHDHLRQGLQADDVARFPKIIDTSFDNKSRPNQNTGDPKLDAIRLNVAVLEEGEVADGRFRVARVTKGPEVTGPIHDQLFAVCVRGRAGGKIVAAQAWVELARDDQLGKLIIDACKTFEILP